MRHLRLYHRLFVIAALVLAGCRTVPEPEPVTEPPVDPVDPVRPVVTAEILRWRDGAQAAVSLTFDDSTLDHYLLAAPELDRRGLQGTFYVITGVMERGVWDDSGTRRLQFSWDQARELAARGHEIGSHSHSHPDISALEFGQAELQLLVSLQRLRREIPQQRGITFAWPYWRSTTVIRSLASAYYIASRAGQATTPRYIDAGLVGARPDDNQRVNALGVRPVEAAELWHAAAQRVLEAEGWAALSLHGIDDGEIPRAALGWQPLPLRTYRAILDYLVEEDFWIAPFAEVFKYLKRRDTTRLHVQVADRRRVVIDIESPLDPLIYDVPLSIALSLPPAWHEVEINADGRPIGWRRASPVVRLEVPADARTLTVTASTTAQSL